MSYKKCNQNKKLFYRIITFIAIIFLLGSLKIKAQDFWNPINGPYSGYSGQIKSIEVNNNGDIFAIAEGIGTIFHMNKSDNKWIERDLPDAGAPEGFINYIQSEISLNLEGDLFVSLSLPRMRASIFISSDNGVVWDEISTFPGLRSTINDILSNSKDKIFVCISGDPSYPSFYQIEKNDNTWNKLGMLTWSSTFSMFIDIFNNIFLDNGGGNIRFSFDGGNEWNTFNIPNINSISTIVANSKGDFIAGTIENGIYISKDSSKTWETMNDGLIDYQINTLSINPDDDLFAGTSDGLYRMNYTDNKWTKIFENNPNEIKVVTLKEINSQENIYVGTDGKGIFTSEDDGNSWAHVGLPLTKINSLLYTPNNKLMAFATSGLLSYEENNNLWKHTGLVDTSILCLISSDRGVLYAGTEEWGVAKSLDNGATWKFINNNLADSTIYTLACDSEENLYAGAGASGILRLAYNSDSWIQTDLQSIQVNTLIIDTNDQIFAGTDSDGVYISSDKGNLWKQKNTYLFDMNVLSSAIKSDSIIFVGTSSGIFKSNNNEDGGWTYASTGLPNDRTVNSILAPTIGPILIGTSVGVFRSDDQGDNWTSVNIEDDSLHIHSLALDRNGFIFYSNMDGQGYKSENSVFSPIVKEPIVTNIQPQKAILNCSVIPYGISTVVEFEFCDSLNFNINSPNYKNKITANEGIISGVAEVPVTAFLTGLLPNMLYYYRIVASSDAGKNDRQDATFKTLKSLPEINIQQCSDLNDRSVVINGNVNPFGLHTDVIFVLNNLDSVVVFQNQINGWSEIEFSKEVLNLKPNTTYYYKIVTYNTLGDHVSDDFTFTTLKSAPWVVTGEIDSLKSTSVILTGRVNPWKINTNIQFEYRLKINPWEKVNANPFQLAGTDTSFVFAKLINLMPDTTYYFRLTAYNNADSSDGDISSFKTLKSAPISITKPATSIQSISATLQGEILPQGIPAVTKFILYRSLSDSVILDASPETVRGRSPVFVQANATNLVPETIYFFKVLAINEIDTSFGNKLSFETISNQPPQISLGQLTSPFEGNVSKLNSTITDDIELYSAKLNFRKGGEKDFNEIVLGINGDEYEWEIPDTLSTSNGIEFYMEAEDIFGSVTKYPTNGISSLQVRIKSPGVKQKNSLPNGNEKNAYRLFSVPLELNENRVVDILGEHLGP